MDILLYNPLSRNGKNDHFIEKIKLELKKQGNPVVVYSLLTIDDPIAFISNCNPDDRIILVGGDGTINRLANRIYGLDIKQPIFIYQAGTGNDFVRSLKTKDKIVSIKQYITQLPYVEFEDQKQYFLNGTGAGLDGYVGYLVNHSRFKKNKLNYFRHAFEAFAKFKPIGANISVDGTSWYEKKVWFTSIMHGPYYGGGMKIAPKANRMSDELDVVIVKKIPKWLLILIFPTIYLGWHVIFKRYVKIIKGHEVVISFDQPTYLQIDGDVEYPIEKIKVFSMKR
jgi:diacylglycerol kinase family enzyme